MRILNNTILLLIITAFCACTLEQGQLALFDLTEVSPSKNKSIASSEDEGLMNSTIYYLQFYYHDESDGISQNYASGSNSRLEKDIEILNHYMEKLELKYRFIPKIPLLISQELGTLSAIDNYFVEKGLPRSDKTINIYIDTVWHNTTPNSYRFENIQDTGNYIFLRKNELGNMPVLLHELIHYLVLPIHERTVDNNGKHCSYLPYHLTADNIGICEDYDKNNLVEHCFNIMSESYYLPLNVFLTEPQKDWINSEDCFGESSMEELCDFALPNGWKDRLIADYGIDEMSCCIVADFTQDDVNDFLLNMSENRSNIIFQIDSIIFPLLTCASETIVPDPSITPKLKPPGVPVSNKGNQNVFDLGDEIESIKAQVLEEYRILTEMNITRFSKEFIIWEENYNYAKLFLIYWFRNSPTYKKWLMIESQLLCENIRQSKLEDSIVAKAYYDNQINILNLAGRQLVNEAFSNKRLNISTGAEENNLIGEKWKLTNVPAALKPMDLPRQVNVVSTQKPITWGEMKNSNWISLKKDGSPIGYSCIDRNCKDCEPFTFEYCFKLTEDVLATVDFNILTDDFSELQIDGPNGFSDTLYVACDQFGSNAPSHSKTKSIYKILELNAGKYCIKANIYNYVSRFGFNLDGYIEAPRLLDKIKSSK